MRAWKRSWKFAWRRRFSTFILLRRWSVPRIVYRLLSSLMEVSILLRTQVDLPLAGKPTMQMNSLSAPMGGRIGDLDQMYRYIRNLMYRSNV